MPIKVKFEAKVKAGIKYDSEVDAFVTFAPALGVYSQGTTKLQAKNALKDAINSFFIVAYEKNVLHSLLHACGGTEDHRAIDIVRASGDEYVYIEEEVLEKGNYEDLFEVQAELPLAA